MGEVKLFFGPNHPGMHGNFSVHMYVEGDVVKRARPLPGFLHRGFEKLMERRYWYSNIALIPRICVPEPDINEACYAMGIEKIIKSSNPDFDIPERAKWIRMIVLELARIANHLMAVGGIGGPIGLYTASHWGMADRDRILDIFEAISGARIYHMYIVPGGVRKNLTPKIEDMIYKTLEYLESRLDDYENLIFKNRILHSRLKGRLILTREQALEMGVTGVGLRATGVEYDIRKVDPYLNYNKVEFIVPTAEEGDAFSRVYLKFKEIGQSIKIIRQALEKMPQTDEVNVKISKGSALRHRVPKGMAFVHIESARGEYGFFVVSDGKNKPYRVAVRGASYPQGLYGIEKYLPGTRIEDVPLWLATMDVCAPEIDR